METKIREAETRDAARLITYLQGLAAEPDILVPLTPGEFEPSIEDEEKFISYHANSDNSVLLVGVEETDTEAEPVERVIAIMGCTGGKRKAERHVAHLGLSVHLEWRGQGIGDEMMSRAIEWAKGTGIISRIELEVYANNAPAIHLYEKYGFVVEGHRKRAFFQRGEYFDSLIMALFV